jgi:hypothetical protein
MALEFGVHTHAENPRDERDLAYCGRVFAILAEEYPGHPWMVGASTDPTVGVIHIRLRYSVLQREQGYGCLLYMSSMSDPDFNDRVKRYGGELLERYGLKRGPATAESVSLAVQHGLDISDT